MADNTHLKIQSGDAPDLGPDMGPDQARDSRRNHQRRDHHRTATLSPDERDQSREGPDRRGDGWADEPRATESGTVGHSRTAGHLLECGGERADTAADGDRIAGCSRRRGHQVALGMLGRRGFDNPRLSWAGCNTAVAGCRIGLAAVGRPATAVPHIGIDCHSRLGRGRHIDLPEGPVGMNRSLGCSLDLGCPGQMSAGIVLVVLGPCSLMRPRSAHRRSSRSSVAVGHAIDHRESQFRMTEGVITEGIPSHGDRHRGYQ